MEHTQDKAEIEKRYRQYCDISQADQLEKLIDFWSLPAMYTVDWGLPDTMHTIIHTPEELQQLYSNEFGPKTGVDETIIDKQQVTFFGDTLACIETTLRHNVKGKLHDTQHAIYGCRKVEGIWMFITHLSQVMPAK